MSWQPIKTAPRNKEVWIGIRIDGKSHYCTATLRFDAGNEFEGEKPYWYWECPDDPSWLESDWPTYWMPIIELPPEGE
jgi:hypothetical protein